MLLCNYLCYLVPMYVTMYLCYSAWLYATFKLAFEKLLDICWPIKVSDVSKAKLEDALHSIVRLSTNVFPRRKCWISNSELVTKADTLILIRTKIWRRNESKLEVRKQLQVIFILKLCSIMHFGAVQWRSLLGLSFLEKINKNIALNSHA